jgi:triphosphoribosyl-dephospho-CoA synthetase
MPTEIDIYRSADLLIRRYGEDAARPAAKRAATLLEGGDMEGRRAWLSILEAIKELQRRRPRRNEPMH